MSTVSFSSSNSNNVYLQDLADMYGGVYVQLERNSIDFQRR